MEAFEKMAKNFCQKKLDVADRLKDLKKLRLNGLKTYFFSIPQKTSNSNIRTGAFKRRKNP